MKRVLVTFAVLFVLFLLTNHAHAGTLDRGVNLSSFFAVWTNGNSSIAQLKYQMAIDTYLGITERYTTILYTYNYDYSTANNTGTFNTFDVDVSNSGDSAADVTINSYNY